LNALPLLGAGLLLCASAARAETIVFVSDLNGRYGSEEYSPRVAMAMEQILELAPDLVVSTGDMVAGQRSPQLDAAQLGRMWTGFNQVVTDPLAAAGVPFAVTVGNHDGSSFPGFETEREQFMAQWSGRRPDLPFLQGSEWPWLYGAWLGETLLIAFDGTRPGEVPEASREFIHRALEENRAKAQHIVVISHLPMWPLAQGREHEVLEDPEFLALLHRYHVDVYASGHHHLYYAGRDQEGLLHISVGALGGNARTFVGQEIAQPYSFTVLEFGDRGVSVHAIPGPDFAHPLGISDLPESVTGPLGTLERSDDA